MFNDLLEGVTPLTGHAGTNRDQDNESGWVP